MMELTPRLKCVYDSLGEGETLIDVGCDHADLAIKLLEDGKYIFACMTDVAEGPLATARRNVEEANIDREKYELAISDGFISVPEPSGDFSVAVCGMGGELIASILEMAPDWVKTAERIILQPMTKACRLRKFLWDNGYEITLERAVAEGERYYVVMIVRFTGRLTEYNDAELHLGKREAREVSRDMQKRLEHFHGKHAAIRHSIASAGGDASEIDALVKAAEAEILDIRGKMK